MLCVMQAQLPQVLCSDARQCPQRLRPVPCELDISMAVQRCPLMCLLRVQLTYTDLLVGLADLVLREGSIKRAFMASYSSTVVLQEVIAAITACSYVATSADAATTTLASFPSAIAPVAVASTEAAATTLRGLHRSYLSAT
jgi:hypothetical protein